MDSAVEKLFEEFAAHGRALYIVGGAVRDILLGETPRDYDLTTDALPDEMIEWFDDVITVGKHFGTVGIIIDGKVYEITTFRKETLYKDGRHPERIVFSEDPREDVMRRDFTVNGLLMDQNGCIYDYVEGLKDIENGMVRCIGKASERFEEDRLRKWRGIRLAAEKGMEVDESLRKAIEEDPLTEGVSAERIATELDRILLSRKVAWGGYLLVRTGLYEELLKRSVPDYAECCGDYLIDSFEIMAEQPPVLELRLAALVINMFPEERRCFLKSMHYSTKVIETVLTLCDDVLVDCTDIVHFKHCLAELGWENAELLLSFRQSLADWNRDRECAEKVEANIRAWRRIKANREPLLRSELAVNGKDMEEAGFKGREISKVLNLLLKHVYRYPEENTKERLMAYLERDDYGKVDVS